LEEPGRAGDGVVVPEIRGKENDGPIPVKVSLKLATRNRMPKAAAKAEIKESAKKSSVKKTVSSVADSEPKKKAGAETAPADTPVADGRYTIQVAAYKAFKDAVTQMSQLKEKGFTSYRTKGEAGGSTWYRVRTGSFKDFQSAQVELDRLKQAKINGMIIKKDDQ